LGASRGAAPGFTKRYGLTMLVYCEAHDSINAAIQREHNIKHWPRRWKTELVDAMNPEWRDLYADMV
jgi:putative endonuclease